MSRSLVTDSMIKWMHFQLDGPRRGSCEGRQSVDPAACNILIMRWCVGRIARDATEKLYAIKPRQFTRSNTEAAADAAAFMVVARCWLIWNRDTHSCHTISSPFAMIIKARYAARYLLANRCNAMKSTPSFLITIKIVIVSITFPLMCKTEAYNILNFVHAMV